MNLLEIKNLSVNADNKPILSNINLVIKIGEKHAILGPNGQGKSTLLQVIMGNPKYQIISGQIIWKNKDITDLKPEDRSKLGIFSAWQNPIAIPGVQTLDYLRLLVNSHSEEKLSTIKFYKLIESKIDLLDMPSDFKERYLNVNFSGGEKKRFEIMQMLLINPQLSMLDEIDSGLDIDSINFICNMIQTDNLNKSFILISHYDKFLLNLNVDYVHILVDGQIVKTGKSDLITEIHNNGFNKYLTKKNRIYLEQCLNAKPFKN
ncbi:MAG: Fe-S cluster assembly ATPase SufC [Mycoplasma sp.]